jgi:hypothetical protein
MSASSFQEQETLKEIKITSQEMFPLSTGGQIQTMMTATQRKKGSDQNSILLQTILPVLSLREIRSQKSTRRGDINLTLQNLMLSERRRKKKKMGE